MKIAIKILIANFIFISCEPVQDFSNEEKIHREAMRNNSDYYTIVYDGCEYVVCTFDSRNFVHKGSCKFCQKRLIKK